MPAPSSGPRQRRARFAKVFQRHEPAGFLQLRRGRRALALAALLLLLLGFASALAVRQLESPTADFVAATLSRILERPVEVAAAELRLGLKLGIEVYGLRVYEADGIDQPPTLEIEYARGEQSWPRVVVGQLVPLDWDVTGPTLRIRTGGGQTATLTPPELPSLNLDLNGGRVEWYRQDGELLVVDELAVSARRSAFGLAMHGQARGRLSREGRIISRFDLRVDGQMTNFTLKGAITALDIAELPLGPVKARGVGKGEIALGVRRQGIEGRAAMTFSGLELELPDLAPIVPENNRLTLDAAYSGGELTLEFQRLELDDLVLQGTVVYRGGPQGHFSANLEFEDFEPVASPTRLQPLRLLGLRYETFMRMGERLGGGRIEDLSIRVDTPLDRLSDVLAFRDRIDPQELVVKLHAEDGIYTPNPGSAPLEQISGNISIFGNTLEVRELRMMREGGDLPRIDLTVDGMHRLVRLPVEERRTPSGPGTPIPGLDAAVRALRAPEAPNRGETWLRFEDLELHYPSFVLPLRGASGLLRFPDNTLVLEKTVGIFGGAPAEVALVWDPGAATIDAQITYLDHEVETRPIPPREWLSGRFETDEFYFDEWRITDLDGIVKVYGADVQTTELRGTLLEGDASGSGALSLAEEEQAAFEFDLELVGGNATALEPHLGLPEGSLDGTLAGAGRLAGALREDRRFIDTADIELSLRLEDGSVGNLPPALVLARLPSLRGVRALLGRDLPYDTIDTIVTINSGKLQLADFKLVGPELRILASGEVDLSTEEYYTDMVVAVLFLQTVDKLLGAIPIVRNIVLGPDKNLLATYFHISGPWGEPKATILAPRAIQTVFGLLTGAIKGSVRQLIKILPLPGSRNKPEDNASGEDNAPGSGQDQEP